MPDEKADEPMLLLQLAHRARIGSSGRATAAVTAKSRMAPSEATARVNRSGLALTLEY